MVTAAILRASSKFVERLHGRLHSTICMTVTDCAFQEDFSGPNVFQLLGPTLSTVSLAQVVPCLSEQQRLPKDAQLLSLGTGCAHLNFERLSYTIQTSNSVSLTPSQAAVPGGPENPNSMLIIESCCVCVSSMDLCGCDLPRRRPHAVLLSLYRRCGTSVRVDHRLRGLHWCLLCKPLKNLLETFFCGRRRNSLGGRR